MSPARITVIGGVEEDGSPHLLGRVGSAGRLRDGRIVLVEANAREIRLFSSDGEHVWSVGREGDGPGEFRQPRFVGQASDDSILIWDDRRARITEVTPDGKVGDVRQVGTLVDQIPPRPRAVLSDDRLLGSFPGEGAPAELSHGEIVHDFSRMYLTDLVWCLQSSAAIRRRMHPLWTAPLAGRSSLELLAVAMATPRRSASPERRLRRLGSDQTSETPH